MPKSVNCKISVIFQACAAAGILLFSSASAAFDVYPEYQGLSESDLAKFERPSDLDSEYQIIINGFAPPLEWEREWQRQTRAFDLSVGSMSNKLFFIYSRLKVQAELLDALRFNFIYFAQRDREVDQSRHIVELSQRISKNLRVNLYGEPSLYKRENDVGLALLYTSGDHWSHRLYYTFHDLTRAEHNDLDDHFQSGRDPRSLGWTAQLDGSEVWSRFGGRYDQPVTWLRPQERRIFLYDKKLIFGDLFWQVREDRRINLRLQWDSTFEGQEPDSPISTAVGESWRLERLQGRVSYLIGLEGEKLRFEPAFTHVQRRWSDHSGQSLQHWNEMPSLTLHLRGTRRAESFDQIRLEYETAWFRRFGDLSLGVDQKRAPVEQRLQTAYEFAFSGRARLLLSLNFDMDQWTPVPTFEGGNGMFRAEF